MRNAESQQSDAFSTCHVGCKDEGGGRSADQNIGIGTFCCTDFSCRFQFRKFHKFCCCYSYTAFSFTVAAR